MLLKMSFEMSTKLLDTPPLQEKLLSERDVCRDPDAETKTCMDAAELLPLCPRFWLVHAPVHAPGELFAHRGAQMCDCLNLVFFVL